MPGVPTGRACDACRKQKKKCDEKQPSCARCLRLKIPCVGSGQVRFKFQEEKQYSTRVKKHHALSTGDSSGSLSDTSSESPSQSQSQSQSKSPPQAAFTVSTTQLPPRRQKHALRAQLLPPESPKLLPSSDISSLAGGFIATIKRTTDLRYNLWWSFGLWLEDVPKRLGTNEALDRAVDTLTTAHSNFSCNRGPSVEALAKHSRALRTLSVYLDDKVHAQSSSTLSAVMILLICQLFLGPSNRKFSGHAEGAAAILRARKDFGPRDAFEAKLFLSMRGSVLFEGIFNDRINLTPEEWDNLVRNDYDSTTPDGKILLNLSKAPHLMRHGREALRTGTDTTSIRNQVWTIYQDCKTNLSILKHRSVENDFSELFKTASPAGRKFILEFGFAHYQRTYGIGLACTLVFNCMLSALDAYGRGHGHGQELGLDDVSVSTTEFDATYLSEEVLDLAKRSVIWKPIGAAYIVVCVSAAWAATSDPLLRAKLFSVAIDFNNDFHLRDARVFEREMLHTTEHLRLGTSFQTCAFLEDSNPSMEMV